MLNLNYSEVVLLKANTCLNCTAGAYKNCSGAKTRCSVVKRICIDVTLPVEVVSKQMHVHADVHMDLKNQA